MKFEDTLRCFARVARQEILGSFRIDSCIASTRITIRVMREFGIDAEPLSVHLVVGNAEWTKRIIDNAEPPPHPDELIAWCERTGAWSVGVGIGEPQPGRWPGHLVAYLPEHHMLIDSSIDQANRPDKGIYLPTVLMPRPVTKEFLSGNHMIEARVNDVFLQYALAPNETFRQSKDWTEFSRIKLPVKRILSRMREAA